MRDYQALSVLSVDEETADSRCVRLAVPDGLRADFTHRAGQHLPIKVTTPDGELRRTYSVCSRPGEWPLKLGIRLQKNGAFSEYLRDRLSAGDTLHALPPSGRFFLGEEAPRHVALFAAGSGITPILSMAAALLEEHAETRVSLFYGNRKQATAMFIEELFALKNRFTDRLQMQFLFSREDQEFNIATGRLDTAKTNALCDVFFGDVNPDAAYICGPDSMLTDVRDALIGRGMPDAHIHFESFGARQTKASAGEEAAEVAADAATVTVIMDGHRRSFQMRGATGSIVDAAAEQGIALPYSCKGGVCATCRTHVQSGDVHMAKNFGLEDWEVTAGFVLACQCVPVSDELVLDYDKA